MLKHFSFFFSNRLLIFQLKLLIFNLVSLKGEKYFAFELFQFFSLTYLEFFAFKNILILLFSVPKL